MSTLLFSTIFILLSNSVMAATPAFPSDLFRTYHLEFEGKLTSYHVEDLNNDGLKDFLLFLSRGDKGKTKQRFLSVFLQNKEGFLPKPTQTFEAADQIILFDIGDVSGDLRKEFVYFARSGIFYYTFSDTGFTLSPQLLFETESIFMLSDKKALLKWDFVADINGDYVDEIVVPRITELNIYFRNPTNNAWLINKIPLGVETKVFAFFNERFSVGNKAAALYSIPYLLFEDFNSDGRDDLLGIYRDSLVVFCQEQSGFFSQTPKQKIELRFGDLWRGAKIQRAHIEEKSERRFLMRIVDLNHDGIIDVVGTKISTKESIINPKTEVLIYFGNKETKNSKNTIYFDPEPDQIIKPGGTQLVLDILDLNQDHKFDFLIPVVKVGITRIIKLLLTKRVEIEAEYYEMGEDGYYHEKPNRRIKMMVRFSFRGGPASPVYEIEDFNGDGYLDILSSLEERRLIIFWGDKKNLINSHVGAKFNVILPQDGDLVKAMDLNGDNKSDVIITYGEEDVIRKKLSHTIKVLMAN
ncbi:MAG: FG-GAP repeat domain-containing protein [bacterium]